MARRPMHPHGCALPHCVPLLRLLRPVPGTQGAAGVPLKRRVERERATKAERMQRPSNAGI